MTAATADDTGSQRVGAVRAITALLRQRGVDSAAVLDRAGLSPEALDRPDNRIPFAAMCRLYAASARATGSPHFGLLAGQAWRLSDMGLAGDIVRHSPTVGVALRNLARFQRLNSRGGAAFVRERGESVDLGYVSYDGEIDGVDQIYDSVLATAHNYLRALCGDGFVVHEVFVAHAKPPNVAPYDRLFRAPVRFDAGFSALRFAASWMRHPVEGADPATYVALLAKATEGDSDIRNDVARALRVLLVDGVGSGDEVAHRLGLNRRTLNRRLRATRTTFQKTLDDVRFAVARQLLAHTAHTMEDVAASLGYGDVASFQRRFRHWARTTPGRWRQAARSASAAARTEAHQEAS